MRPKDGRVVSNFICAGSAGQAPDCVWRWVQTRSFCYVDDLVRGIVALLRKVR